MGVKKFVQGWRIIMPQFTLITVAVRSIQGIAVPSEGSRPPS